METTGVKPHRNGIHQIGGIIDIDGQERERFNFNVRPNPRCEIEDEALKVGGVTKEQIMAYPPMEEVYAKFVGMLSRYVSKYDKKDKFYLVGYNNASFDNAFLRGFFLQNNDKYFGLWFWPNCMDVYVMVTPLLFDLRPTIENVKLMTVAKAMGLEVDDSKLHDATYDIELTRSLYYIIMKKYLV